MRKDEEMPNTELLKFLKRYCVSLSELSYFSIARMSTEAGHNARLKYPLCLYCALSNRERYLKTEQTQKECEKINEAKCEWPEISREYWKVSFAFQSRKKWEKVQDESKSRLRSILLQKEAEGVRMEAVAKTAGVPIRILKTFMHDNQNNAISTEKTIRLFNVLQGFNQ